MARANRRPHRPLAHRLSRVTRDRASPALTLPGEAERLGLGLAQLRLLPLVFETRQHVSFAHALVRLGAALAIDAAPSWYRSNVDVAVLAGASVDEIVGTLIAIAPIVGLARVVSAAPQLALALGYDVDAALEARGADVE